MIIGYASRFPLALTSLYGPGSQYMCGFLNRFPASLPNNTYDDTTRRNLGRVDAAGELRSSLQPPQYLEK